MFTVLGLTNPDTILKRMHQLYRVKSGNFGHQVNSDIHLQTVEIQMNPHQDFHCLLSSFICLFQKLKINGTNKVAVRIYLMSEVT